ncbi:type IV pili methyl-accepting chemotaxis transducer N-terminal domain-containing protein [Janthinobacterium sp. 17J80-10]|uniref:type IV pili methyl-accepting chemotaxis transducer N-terminal domain-containing protein n=1 Tax=Janthinobacterium sp. 17J80-10 TaxID=2497863 RepID=UPI0010056A73|nr:type IV pili methyl-accepting chemotaxis transducer N-terminal domain-containing protein [Janthinobacterium sp. 17J80-10]QAU32865.1 chemotaxis protein CheA [Janthinobacterium sp. 17J80-10]
MKANSKITSTGKYREIILAVAFFLVFDLAVLVLNFYISFQISEDALAINLAGRQRMLSQRMTKALLTTESDVQRGVPDSGALAELKKTVNLFDSTLIGFQRGAMVTGGNEKPIYLAAVTIPQGQAILQKAEAIWLPYKKILAPLVAERAFTPEQLAAADRYARANNLKLLALMNELTTQLEQTANAKADMLRTVQTIGIVLALLNFAFILFKFIRRLQANDRKVGAAQKETAEILGTVKDGLFLLDAQFRIGSQFSQSLPHILGRPIVPDSDFRTVLQEMMSQASVTTACDYIELLFGDRVKEALVAALNPMSALEVMVADANGMTARRFLKFQFNRVLENDKTSHLLVTVIDVTKQIELERALELAKREAKAEMEIMLDLLKVNPVTLNQFLETSERTLLEVNDFLRSAGNTANYRSTISTIFRKIHTLKGEAAALDLEMFENLAQQFETQLAGLREKGDISGDDLLALPFPLEEFLQRVAMVRSLVERLAGYHDAFTPAVDDQTFAQNLAKLSQRIALDNGKEVRLDTDLALLGALPHQTRNDLQDITVQLLRNAIAHGIEPAPERAGLAKPSAGNIQIALKQSETGEYELMLRDDGRGLVPHKIREALLQARRYTEAQLNELDDRQVVMKIFEPGFSTAGKATRDAGHGVGMDVVKHKVEQLGARIRLSSRENAFTQFSIHFAI